MPSEHPYIKARLVNSDKDLSHTWYIVFYAWDALQGKKIKKRDYDVNQYKTRRERLDFAEKRIKAIDAMLKEGYHVNAKQRKAAGKLAINLKSDFTVEQAFKFILQFVKLNKRPATYNVYASQSRMFLEFCALHHWQKYKIDKLERIDLLEYLDYQQTHNEFTNRTRNNYLGALKTMFGLMMDRDMIKVNPCVGIKDEPVDIGRNIAFTPAEIQSLKAAICDKMPRLWIFVQFLFYGFIRPAEIARIRVNMVNLDNNEIVLPGDITKNRKTRYVRISPNFKKYIEALELQNHRPHDFIFGYNLQTGQKPLQKNYASSQHSVIIKDKNFGSDYTLYSWKHTGVVMHYKAGVDIKSLQAQTGHSSLSETDTYLKSLGLFVNREIEDKSPAI